MLSGSVFVPPSGADPSKPSDSASSLLMTQALQPPGPFASSPQRLSDGVASDSLPQSGRSAFAQPTSVSSAMSSQFNPLLSPFSPSGYQMPFAQHPLLPRPPQSGMVPPALSSSLLPTDIAALVAHLQQQTYHPSSLPQTQQAPPQPASAQAAPSNPAPTAGPSSLLPSLPPHPSPSADPQAAAAPPGPATGLTPDSRISLTAQDLVLLLDLFARGAYSNQQGLPIPNPLSAPSLWPGAPPSTLASTIAQLDTSQPMFPVPMPSAPAPATIDSFSRALSVPAKKRHAEPEPLIAPEAKPRAVPAPADHVIEEKGLDGKSLPRIRCSFPNCTKSFTKMTNLRRHQRLHNGHKPFTCPWTSGSGSEGACGKRFARRADLRAHERTHTGEKPYQCSVCSRTFARNSDWRSHERTHQKIKPFTCDVAQCHRSFARRTDIKKHFKTHSELNDAEINAKIQNLSAHRSSSAESDHPNDSDATPPSPPQEKETPSKRRKVGGPAGAIEQGKVKTTMTSEQAESWWDLLPSATTSATASSASS